MTPERTIGLEMSPSIRDLLSTLAVLAFLMKFANWPHHADFVQTPLPVLTTVMFVLGIQFFLMGLLAEMLVRTYHESQAKPIYAVKERINFTTEDTEENKKSAGT